MCTGAAISRASLALQHVQPAFNVAAVQPLENSQKWSQRRGPFCANC
jgi:hypothetical protein